MSRRIGALIVTYQPDLALLRRSLQAVAPQVNHVLLIDNASSASPETMLAELDELPLTLLTLEQNLGLATAQNRGMDWLHRHGFDHALLLDQDSLPESDMVIALTQALDERQAAGDPVAAVGPLYIDPRTGSAREFVRFRGLGIQRTRCTEAGALPAVDFLISSGTLLPMGVYERVGPFEDALFIDNVDLEWCFRARGSGHRLYGVCAARMQHQLGDQTLRIWLGRWWQVYRHSPRRQYFIARNRLALYRRSYSPRGWIVQDLLRFPLKLFWFGLVFAPRRENLRMILRGAWDGWRGRLGPFPDSSGGT